MRRAVTRLLIAAVLFGGAAIFWSEAALARRVADAQVRLATLHYDEEDGIGEGSTPLNRIAVPVISLDDDIRRHRAQVAYWRTRADAAAAGAQPAPVAPLPGVRGGNVADGDEPTDADLMFVATNTAFRAATRQTADRAAAVERLDTVIQAYAEVLRADAANADAAYNYEYAVRLRDTIARGRPGPRARRSADDELGASVDLPAGPTIHGRPGGPPPEIPGDQFRTIAPMPYEEREESDPGRGPAPRRRG